jgi:8-oxo-dGTP pyrophosphatase MutT (NUDIX family)
MSVEANPWKTITTRTVYENPWLRLREDKVIRPDGSDGIYSVLELPESVCVAAITNNNQIALVEQWRYTHNRLGLELPSGGSDGSDSTILDAAKRELKEETGLTAALWEYLGCIENSNGATTDLAHLFVATQLSTGKATPEQSESDLRLRWIDLDNAIDRAYQGDIRESTSVALLMKLYKRSTS